MEQAIGHSETLRIAKLLKIQGLPPPQFDVSSSLDTFQVIMYAGERYAKSTLRALGLSDRQLKALEFLKSNHDLTNAQYQTMFDASKATATHDLRELAHKGLMSIMISRTSLAIKANRAFAAQLMKGSALCMMWWSLRG